MPGVMMKLCPGHGILVERTRFHFPCKYLCNITAGNDLQPSIIVYITCRGRCPCSDPPAHEEWKSPHRLSSMMPGMNPASISRYHHFEIPIPIQVNHDRRSKNLSLHGSRPTRQQRTVRPRRIHLLAVKSTDNNIQAAIAIQVRNSRRRMDPMTSSNGESWHQRAVYFESIVGDHDL